MARESLLSAAQRQGCLGCFWERWIIPVGKKPSSCSELQVGLVQVTRMRPLCSLDTCAR